MENVNNAIDFIIRLIANLIILCNDNSGFISAILTIVTIVISIRIGKMPYEKKLVLYHYLDNDEADNVVVEIYVSNVGSCPIYVDSLVIKEGRFKVITQCNEFTSLLISDHLINAQETRNYSIKLPRYKIWSSRKRKALRIVLKAGNKTFRYKADWAMG